MNVLDLHAKTVLLVKIFPEVTNVTVNPDLQAETAEKVNFTKMVIYCYATCLNIPGSFLCSCRAGFTERNCDTGQLTCSLFKVPMTRKFFCIFWLTAVFKIRNNRPRAWRVLLVHFFVR